MTNPTEAPMANAIDDVKEWVLVPRGTLADIAERLERAVTEHLTVEGAAEEIDDVAATTATQIYALLAFPAPSQHKGWSDEAVEGVAWVLVPKEPTEAMLEASISPRTPGLTDAHLAALRDGFATKYRAMLAVAPPSPADGVKGCQDIVATATREMLALAVYLHRAHYPEVEQWKPLDDVLGLISQVDNMTTGLTRASAAPLPQIGEAIYRAMYQHQGGLWEANETQEVWTETGYRFVGFLSAPLASSIAPATGFEVKAPIEFVEKLMDIRMEHGSTLSDNAQALWDAATSSIRSSISPSVSKESGEP